MKQDYFPPTFNQKEFHCALCHVYAGQVWHDVFVHTGTQGVGTGIRTSYCYHCKERTFWYEERMIIPDEAPVELPHPDLPADCLAEYTEARGVFSKSTRASAALLRLCIQKLLPYLGETGENINNDIKSLVAKGLPSQVQKALDYCRVVGNNAVHPGEIDLNDTPDIAQNLFRMVNFIVEDRITRPKEIEALYNQLPEASRGAIDKRDKTGNN